MKRYLICLVAAFAALSCVKDEEYVQRYKASLENLQTKSVLNVQDGSSMWRPFESVSVFCRKAEPSRFTSQNNSFVKSADFVGPLAKNPDDVVYALSPYNHRARLSGSAIQTVLPVSQTGIAGGVQEGLLAQVCSTVNDEFLFRHVYGGYYFTVDTPGIRSLTIKSLGSEAIAGKVSISIKDGMPVCEVLEPETSIVLKPSDGNSFQTGVRYSLVMIPGVLSKGFSVTAEGSFGTKTVSFGDALRVERGVFKIMEHADRGNVPVPSFMAMVDKGQPFELVADHIGHVMEVGDCYVAQGAACDGKYVYFVLRNKTDDGAVILKYSLSPFAVVDCSERFNGGHCNDLTYNDKTGKVILAHGQSQGQILTVIDAATLKVEGNVNITVGSGAITYSKSRDMYAISQGGTSLHFADGSLKTLSSHTRTDATGFTAQGMGSDDKYIYFPMSKSSQNILVVYDWNAKYVMTLTIPVALESESMFSVGDDHYVCFFSGGAKLGADLYKIRPKDL